MEKFDAAQEVLIILCFQISQRAHVRSNFLVLKFHLLSFVMNILICVVFIMWSPKLLNSCVIPGYDNLAVQTNHSSNHEPKSAVPMKMNCTLKSCLQKCCPACQIYSSVNNRCFSPSADQLSALAEEWTVNFPHFNILTEFSCQKNTIILNKSRGQEYLLDESGILHESLRNLDHNPSTFCFEYILEDKMFMPFICPDGLFNDEVDEKWRFMFYAYGMIVSNLFLLVTFGLYISTPALHRSVQNKSFASYVISLIFGFSFLMAAQNIRKFNAICTVIAYMTQFWLLARFFWLNVMCIDIRQAVNASKLVVQTSKRKFTFYCLYAWGCPLLISVVTVLNQKLLTNNHWRPGLGEDDCWFRKYSGHYLLDPKFLYFYSMISITLIINFCIFFDTALTIRSRNQKWNQKPLDSRRHKQHQKRLSLHLKLFVVMGLNWILDMASYYVRLDAIDNLWFIIDMINSLQGVFIFVIFVCNKKVMYLLEKRFFPKRTFSKEYGRLVSNRTLHCSSRQFQFSRTTNRLLSARNVMDRNTAEGNA